MQILRHFIQTVVKLVAFCAICGDPRTVVAKSEKPSKLGHSPKSPIQVVPSQHRVPFPSILGIQAPISLPPTPFLSSKTCFRRSEGSEVPRPALFDLRSELRALLAQFAPFHTHSVREVRRVSPFILQLSFASGANSRAERGASWVLEQDECRIQSWECKPMLKFFPTPCLRANLHGSVTTFARKRGVLRIGRFFRAALEAHSVRHGAVQTPGLRQSSATDPNHHPKFQHKRRRPPPELAWGLTAPRSKSGSQLTKSNLANRIARERPPARVAEPASVRAAGEHV